MTIPREASLAAPTSGAPTVPTIGDASHATERSGLGASSRNSHGTKCFSSLAFSADGAAVLAGGASKFVCLYSVAEKQMLKK